MIQRSSLANLVELYHVDETAWLERMAILAAQGDAAELDLAHLSEYLVDMARRDKREVMRRLTLLLAHLLKWDHQPDKRSRSWELTIQVQRDELSDLFASATLRNYAEQKLSTAYERALRRASLETGLAADAFPSECAYSLDQALGS